MVDTFGTGKVSEEKLVEIVRENFDLRPAGIIKMLDLRRPIYKQTSSYGHFGRNDLNLPWGKTGQSRSIEKIFITVDGMPLLVYSNTKEVRKIKKKDRDLHQGLSSFLY